MIPQTLFEDAQLPTVLRIEGYRLYFYNHEPNEPPHVHIDKAGSSAKVWLIPVGLARSVGFRPKDINAILKIVRERRAQLIEDWHGYFGGQRG